MPFHFKNFYLIYLLFMVLACQNTKKQESSDGGFRIVMKAEGDEMVVVRAGSKQEVLTQNAKADMRPYLHPIMAPDGNGALTEYSPGHHKHQTGLYWGFTRVNGTGVDDDTLKKWFYKPDKPKQIQEQIGRDYFHNNGGSHWRRKSLDIVKEEGTEVQWRTVYEMLDADGGAILEETALWTLTEHHGQWLIDLEWQGKALTEITINEFSYGGLFLRMPWKDGIEGEVVNVARQKNGQAEGQRAMWVDIGMEIEGRSDWGHIALFDHPQNGNYPTPWRVDGQLGVGPCRAISGDWKIAEGHTEIIKHRLVAYTGELNDVALTENWKTYIGDQGMYVTAELWNLARAEGKSAKFLTPAQAVENMTVTPGYKVNAWASEPMITQPMAFCWDNKGRLWVAENRDYENRQQGFSNDGNSRILIIEDTDRDGTADSKKVFAEGIPFPAALAVGFDGVFVGAPPNLLFVPDRNRDDQAEMDDVEVRLTGWGIRDRHETLNSFQWGPDGWLYGLEGFATPSKIRKPAGKGKIYGYKDPFPDVLAGDGVDINGGVWRYHPIKDRFEVVAHGFSNPWGIDYDAKGQLFITACVIPHMFHVIPGGIYHRQGGQHFNPYVYQDIRTIVDHSHRSAHGGARIYQSDAFPPEQQGRLFMANIHEHAVLSDVLEPKGSGFVAKHGEDFVMANNAQWIGFSMEVGPGGDLYVLDWHDADICGNSVMQKETGRIFRISPQESLVDHWEGRFDDLEQLSDEALADLQTSKSNWHARRARVILQSRAVQEPISIEARDLLVQIFSSSENTDHRLRGLWGLHLTNNISTTELVSTLDDADPHVRAWAVQLLCEDFNASEETLEKFRQMARSDDAPVVRLYLAAALQRVHEESKWEIVEGLLSHGVDADDHNIPKMIWFGLEPLVVVNPEKAMRMAKGSQIPLVSQFIARRLVDADNINPILGSLTEKSPGRKSILVGLRNGLEGRSDVAMPAQWNNLRTGIQKNSELADLVQTISQQFGDAEAAARSLADLQSISVSTEKKNAAIRALSAKQWPELEQALPALWEQEALRIEAIRAVAAYDSWNLGRALLEQYPSFSPTEKLEVVQAMASRTVYGNLITSALQKELIPKRDIPAYVARQLRRVVGNGFVETWGPIDDLGFDRAHEFEKYRLLLTDAAIQSADLNNGRNVFQRSCGACHKLYDVGGVLGPDLTGSNRANLDYILSNMLDPSGEIQDDYKMVVVTTRDGRTYAGNIQSENERQLRLRVAGQDPVTINKSEIQSRETAPNSMMPEGLLQTLTDQEVIDLVAYLRTEEEVDL